MEEKTVPDNANENCPGVESDQAGKGSNCEGCPNQQICASGAGKEEDTGKLFSEFHLIHNFSFQGHPSKDEQN